MHLLVDEWELLINDSVLINVCIIGRFHKDNPMTLL